MNEGEAAEAFRESGKARFVGLSTHHPRRAESLQAEATGGFFDVIMLQNNRLPCRPTILYIPYG